MYWKATFFCAAIDANDVDFYLGSESPGSDKMGPGRTKWELENITQPKKTRIQRIIEFESGARYNWSGDNLFGNNSSNPYTLTIYSSISKLDQKVYVD